MTGHHIRVQVAIRIKSPTGNFENSAVSKPADVWPALLW
jgi:hypothetical protein